MPEETEQEDSTLTQTSGLKTKNYVLKPYNALK